MTAYHTPVTYSAPEVTTIRAQIAAGDPPICPRCRVPLQEVEGPPASKVLLFEAYCPQCRHCLFLRHEDAH